MIYDSVLTCKICNEFMVDPVLVRSCYHTFCRFCAVKQIRNSQSNCPVCGKNFELEESEALVRDTILQKKLRQYASEDYYIKMNNAEEFRKKRVPSSYEVVVLRDNNLSSLVTSLCAPYEKISFCLEYYNPDFEDKCHTSIYDEPSTSHTYVELQPGEPPVIIKSEPVDYVENEKESIFFKRYFMASALTSLEALQLLLEKILETRKHGFTLYFLDFDGKSVLDNKWSLRDVGYIFSWDRRSILTIRFALKCIPSILCMNAPSTEESVVSYADFSPSSSSQTKEVFTEATAVHAVNAEDLHLVEECCGDGVTTVLSSNRKRPVSLKRRGEQKIKKPRRASKTSKVSIPDDPIVMERVRYILKHGHPPPDDESSNTSNTAMKSGSCIRTFTPATSLFHERKVPESYSLPEQYGREFRYSSSSLSPVSVSSTGSANSCSLSASDKFLSPVTSTRLLRVRRRSSSNQLKSSAVSSSPSLPVAETVVSSTDEFLTSNFNSMRTSPSRTKRRCVSSSVQTDSSFCADNSPVSISRESSVGSSASECSNCASSQNVTKRNFDEEVTVRSYAFNCSRRMNFSERVRRLLAGRRLTAFGPHAFCKRGMGVLPVRELFNRPRPSCIKPPKSADS